MNQNNKEHHHWPATLGHPSFPLLPISWPRCHRDWHQLLPNQDSRNLFAPHHRTLLSSLCVNKICQFCKNEVDCAGRSSRLCSGELPTLVCFTTHCLTNCFVKFKSFILCIIRINYDINVHLLLWCCVFSCLSFGNYLWGARLTTNAFIILITFAVYLLYLWYLYIILILESSFTAVSYCHLAVNNLLRTGQSRRGRTAHFAAK